MKSKSAYDNFPDPLLMLSTPLHRTQIDDFSLLSTELRTTSAPVLHVLFHRPITDGINQMPYPHGLYSDSLRSELIEWIANEGLGGDLEAAEWVLFACISNM